MECVSYVYIKSESPSSFAYAPSNNLLDTDVVFD